MGVAPEVSVSGVVALSPPPGLIHIAVPAPSSLIGSAHAPAAGLVVLIGGQSSITAVIRLSYRRVPGMSQAGGGAGASDTGGTGGTTDVGGGPGPTDSTGESNSPSSVGGAPGPSKVGRA